MPEAGLIFAAVLLLSFAVYIHFVSANATDKNWLLTAARKFLSGRELYRDIFEVNPPLVIWIYSVPVWLSIHAGGLSDANYLALIGLAAVALVVALCWRLLEAHPAFAGHPGRQVFFALLLAYVCIFFTAPMYFFDREHILFTLTFPYVLRFSPGLAQTRFPPWLSLAVGLLAAAGFCIKPHALVVFALLQIFVWRRARSPAVLVNVENMVVCGLGACYLGGVAVFLPEYIRTVLPLALATYSAYSRKVSGISSIAISVAMLGVALVDFRPGHRTPYRATVYYFLGLCLAYLLYALLNNGWSYTYQPLMAMVRVTTGWVLLEFLWLRREAATQGLPQRPFLFGARSSASVLVLNAAFFLLFMGFTLMPVDCSLSCKSTGAFFTQARAVRARSFGSMSLEFYKWSELSRETGEAWDTRFNHLWMLPKLFLAGSDFRQKHQDILTFVGRAYAWDLERWKPDVMYIDVSPEFFHGHGPVDLIALLMPVPAFALAWSHYRPEGLIDACQRAPSGKSQADSIQFDCRFQLYRRVPGA